MAHPDGHRNNMARGFTLLEMAITLGLLGLILSGLLAVVPPVMQSNRTSVNETKMTRITTALSIYAQRNSRIPCPSETTGANQPVGAEVGSGSAGANTPTLGGNGCEISSGTTMNEGIVPYRTLGLTPTDALDAQGHFFTYRVSPAFARNPSSGPTVHAACRTSSWVSSGVNLNAMRATFCCANTALSSQDIIIQDAAGVSLYPFSVDTANYATANTLYSGTIDPATNNVIRISFVLVSHGDDGGGYYQSTGGTRLAVNSMAGTGETENADGDRSFVSTTAASARTTSHFDDMIIWRTQDQLYAETGTGSCALP